MILEELWYFKDDMLDMLAEDAGATLKIISHNEAGLPSVVQQESPKKVFNLVWGNHTVSLNERPGTQIATKDTNDKV